MGAASAQAFFRSTLPEILPAYLTNALYLLEGNVRHSAILGYVGAGGIGLLLNEKVSWREYDKVGTILLLLFAVVYLMEHLSTWLTRLVQQERTLGRQGAGCWRARRPRWCCSARSRFRCPTFPAQACRW